MTNGPRKETAYDEVFDAQRTFRVLLDSMSRPGRIYELPAPAYEGVPDGMSAHGLTVLKTLCDNLVSIAFAPPREELRDSWRRYLNLNTASPVRPVAEAAYALFDGASYATSFDELPIGDTEFPERGATAVLQVRRVSVESIAGLSITAVGPGIQTEQQTIVAGLDPRYLSARDRACDEYPMGIDLILVDQSGAVASYPRSSTVTTAP